MISFEFPYRLISNLGFLDVGINLRIKTSRDEVTIDIIDSAHIMFGYIHFKVVNSLGREEITWVTAGDFTKFLKLIKKADNIYIDIDKPKKTVVIRTKGKKHTLREIMPDLKEVKCENADGEMVDIDMHHLETEINQVKYPMQIKCNNLKWLVELVNEGIVFGETLAFEKEHSVKADSITGSMECNLGEAYEDLKIEGDIIETATFYANKYLAVISNISMDEFEFKCGDNIPINIHASTQDGIKLWVALAPRVEEDNIGGV
jgi:hypothetical protein